jgi:hypothetical protein
MAATLQLQRNGDQRIGVAVGADIRENNAQMGCPRTASARNYEGNARGFNVARLWL